MARCGWCKQTGLRLVKDSDGGPITVLEPHNRPRTQIPCKGYETWREMNSR